MKQRDDGFSDVVNIGGGRPRSINQILDIIKGVSGADVPFNRMAANKSDVSRTSADYGYLQSLIGKHPSISAETGLQKFFEWASRDDIKVFLKEWAQSTK